jgi:flagellar biosynthesis/type III secretory pathway M-ring protein FliF/YscJ
MAPLSPSLVVVNNSNLTTEQKKSILRTRIIAISVGLGITVLAFAIFLYARFRRSRQSRKTADTGLDEQVPPEDRSAAEAPLIQSDKPEESKYHGSGADEANRDQNQGLLANAENPANGGWDEVQRPASIASFTSRPIQYEEYQSQTAGFVSAGVVKA